jgi:hypothetical protein
MKKIAVLMALVLGCISLQAQEYYLNLHQSGQVIYQKSVNEISNMNFQGSNPIMLNINGTNAYPITDFDSITFVFQEAPQPGDTVFINYNGNTATVSNPYPSWEVAVTVNGAKVSITAMSTSLVTYCLTGTANPGRFEVESTTTPTIVMNGVSLTNPTGKAMDLTCDAGIVMELADGTDNTIQDGAESDKKAALLSNNDLLIQGNGSLTVTGFAQHAIKVKGQLTVNSGMITIPDAINDGIHTDDFVMHGGSLDITVTNDQSKGIKADNAIDISGGNITVLASGSTVLEQDTINGVITNVPSYCTAIKSDTDINISGGTFNITLPTTNQGGKSISADSNMTISGGDFTITTNGNGAAYTVSGNTKDSYTSSCLKCDGNMEILAGTFNLSSTGTGGKGINAGGTMKIGLDNANNDNLILNVTTTGERITVTAGGGGGWPPGPGQGGDYANPKAIKAQGNLTINSGTIHVECLQTQNEGGEGIESKAVLTINGGNIEVYSKKDDAVNASSRLVINGGVYYAHSDANDGTDSNGTMELNGGFNISNGSRAPEEGFDCDNNQFKITGGTSIGTGGGTSGPTSSVCTQPSVRINTQPNYALQIVRSDGTVICTYKCPAFASGGGGGPGGGNNMVVLFTDPQLQMGQTYTIKYGGTISGGTNWNGYYTGNVTYSGGQTVNYTVNSMFSSVNAGGSGW